MNLQNILVVLRAQEKHLEQIRLAAPGANVIRQSVKELKPAQVAQADVIIGSLPPEFHQHMTRAKLLQLNMAGVSAPFLALGQSHPELVLCCASGAYGPAIGEHLLAALLTMMKHLHLYRDRQFRGIWDNLGEVDSPNGAKVLVLGMGDIGSAFARLVSGMGAEVIGIRRRPASAPEGVSRIATMAELDALLPWADVVAMALPETEQTKGLMNAGRFALMKEGSYLLNVGRGSALDQEALLEALRGGRLAGAHIDVTLPEPLPPEHPLWQEPRLLLTPHISGLFNLSRTLDLIYDIAAHNVRALREGGAFRSRVDFETGYRA